MTAFVYIKLYLLTVPVFFAVDLLWLGVIARDFYRDNLGHLLAATVNWPAAIVFYLLFIVGILYFAVAPALTQGSLWRAIINGLLFGFFTYVTYELTNLATLPDWPIKVVLVDTAWGMVLCAAVAGLSYGIGRWLQNV
ncbi:MAG: DUF2177 family protein [Lamprocystis purpurea]|jgi:uncharacterized membrane protein|uniref:DUF2177 family protein n=1 Tax=Lamprocystis purpurea TaxID=61598 RepID=UPI0003617B25|nr:DUF2177 family protein [Lamprocystis purpurea]MBV5273796.1 DUF2177 family protein [Lamprocystis purpurea]